MNIFWIAWVLQIIHQNLPNSGRNGNGTLKCLRHQAIMSSEEKWSKLFSIYHRIAKTHNTSVTVEWHVNLKMYFIFFQFFFCHGHLKNLMSSWRLYKCMISVLNIKSPKTSQILDQYLLNTCVYLKFLAAQVGKVEMFILLRLANSPCQLASRF